VTIQGIMTGGYQTLDSRPGICHTEISGEGAPSCVPFTLIFSF
jgi:hypothetical protein